MFATPKDLNALVDLPDSGGVAPVEVDGQQIPCVSVYETARSRALMYLLRSGQRILPHKHSAIDDVFVTYRSPLGMCVSRPREDLNSSRAYLKPRSGART